MATEYLNNKYMKGVSILLLKSHSLHTDYKPRKIHKDTVDIRIFNAKNKWVKEGEIIFKGSTVSIFFKGKPYKEDIPLLPYVEFMHAFFHGFAFSDAEFDQHLSLLKDEV